jgi:hypothetical protein
VNNIPCDVSYLAVMLKQHGFKVLPMEICNLDADVCSAMQQRSGSVAVVGRGPNGQPVVSIATGWMSMYSITSSSGTQEVVSVPQCIELPHTTLPAAVLELVLATTD